MLDFGFGVPSVFFVPNTPFEIVAKMFQSGFYHDTLFQKVLGLGVLFGWKGYGQAVLLLSPDIGITQQIIVTHQQY